MTTPKYHKKYQKIIIQIKSGFRIVGMVCGYRTFIATTTTSTLQGHVLEARRLTHTPYRFYQYEMMF